MYLENENIRDLAGLQVQVTVMASYGIISLSKKLTHNCFSLLRSVNEYLFIDCGGHYCCLGPNIMQQTGTCRPWCPVPELRHGSCPWMTLAKLHVDCSADFKPPRSTWKPCF